jgi:hypothetical protein
MSVILFPLYKLTDEFCVGFCYCGFHNKKTMGWKMAGISKAISDKLYSRVREDLKKSAREGDVSRKLQAIKSAKEYGITLVAKIYGVSRLSVHIPVKSGG